MAWSDAARAAALATRQANAKGKQQTQPRPAGAKKPGPQKAAHPNAGQRVAFALRSKMQHDAAKADRIVFRRRIGTPVEIDLPR